MKFLQHLKSNWQLYLLGIFFVCLGYFDATQQNRFLTANYRLPFFSVGVMTFMFVCVVSYVMAELCPTQSWLYKKMTMTTAGYWLTLIVFFFAMRDPGKGQNLLYVLNTATAFVFGFHKDPRLDFDEGTPAWAQAHAKEAKVFRWAYFLPFTIIFVLQNVFYFYVSFKYYTYFNPFEQITLGLCISLLAFTLCKTRLDIFKLTLATLAIVFLVLGLLLFMFYMFYVWDYWTTGFIFLGHLGLDNILTPEQLAMMQASPLLSHIHDPVGSKIIIVAGIAVSILFYALSKSFKNWSGVVAMLAVVAFFIDNHLLNYAIVYY